MRVALDTNILAYAEGINGAQMKDKTLALLAALPAGSVLLSSQVLAELFNLLVRKVKQAHAAAETSVTRWRNEYETVDTSASVLESALELAVHHQFTIWDALVLSAAAEGGCRLLLSEDLHDGFSWRGVITANPFAASRNPLLAGILRQP
ncbi:MAG TPA: PIN domain-containing protein [Candidatus Acidoferrales bacterium]|nr:PIN domain-containing protein [Candidatus Acidoferrales bacterium]